MDLTRSSAKDFGKHPELLAGHVERVKRAHAVAETYMKASPLEAYGLIRREELLGDDLAEAVAEEIMAVGIGDAKRADSIVAHAPVSSASRICAHFMRPEVLGLFVKHHREVEAKFDANLYRQHLFNRPDDNDVQKVFHSDTFFPAVKFWYFPRAVGVDDGPLWYVPYSPVLSQKLLDWHQRQVDAIAAGRVEPWRGYGHAEGSLRINEKELAALDLIPEPIVVEADTLIIANVFGFHRRGDVKQPTHRLALNGSIRIENPI